MPQYVLKVLVNIDARDDIEARQLAAAMVQNQIGKAEGIRDIILHAHADHKSIRMNVDGSFPGQWNKGGPATLKS